MTEEPEKKEEIKLDFKLPSFKKLESKKLATIFGTLIIGIFIGAVIITLFNVGGNISNEVAGKTAAEYLTGNFLAQQGMSAESSEVIDDGSYFTVNVDIMQGELKKEVATVYISKDGKSMIIGQLFDLTQPISPITGSTTNEPAPTVTKSDKPEVELFVMTHCPYGTQAEKGFIPAIELLGNKIDVSIKFVHYFLHEPENTETPIQVCIREEQQSKFLAYLKEFLKEGDSDAALTKAAIDKAKLDVCKETKADSYYESDSALSEGYGIRGSPSLVINGQSVQSGRSAAAYLETICSAFNTQPSECDEVLDSTSPSPGFGYSTTSAPTTAQC